MVAWAWVHTKKSSRVPEMVVVPQSKPKAMQVSNFPDAMDKRYIPCLLFFFLVYSEDMSPSYGGGLLHPGLEIDPDCTTAYIYGISPAWGSDGRYRSGRAVLMAVG